MTHDHVIAESVVRGALADDALAALPEGGVKRLMRRLAVEYGRYGERPVLIVRHEPPDSARAA